MFQIRHDAELSHHSLNCLTQLSSLNGSVMTKKETRQEYLANFLKHFLGLLDALKAHGSIEPMEALGCSNIVRKLMIFYPPRLLVMLETSLLESYLRQITELTCHFMKAATHRSSVRLQYCR